MHFGSFTEELNISKSNQTSKQDNALTCSRISSENANGMDLEYLNIDFQNESPVISLTKKPNSQSSQNYSKDSLKFARRISKSFLQFLKQDNNTVLEAFLECGSTLLASQAGILGVRIIDNEGLIRGCLQQIGVVWSYFARHLSCTHNQKISKVTKDTWDIVFTEEGFWKAAKEARSILLVKNYFSDCGAVEVELLTSHFKKILFLVNRGLILVFLHMKKIEKDDFYENIVKFENYIVLSLVPELFDTYNHKRGVFVDECCRCCKVCQSKFMDKSITRKIKTAWEYAISFEQSFRSSPLLPLNILQFLTLLDDAIASFSN